MVGRISLYLLDTNIPANPRPEDRDITDQLYGGDNETRLKPGDRARHRRLPRARGYGPQPTVYHMNEGHSAFLAIEHIRMLMDQYGLTFEEARELAEPSLIFTTHTPVAAGHRFFDSRADAALFLRVRAIAGVALSATDLGLGQAQPVNREERFSMAVLATRHLLLPQCGEPAASPGFPGMCELLWPGTPVWEVPITSRDQRRPSAHPGFQSRSFAALRSVSPAATGASGSNDSTTFGSRSKQIPDEELVEDAPPPQTPPGRLCARAARCIRLYAGQASASRSPAVRRGARSKCVHHRFRTPLCDVQARHAAVPPRHRTPDRESCRTKDARSS